MAKPVAAVAASLLLAACMSGPRPYDGVIGYRVQATPGGLAVSYVDQADASPAKVLRRIHQVCADRLGGDPASVVVTVTASRLFQQDVPLSVPVVVGMNSSGAGGSQQGAGGVQTSASTFHDTVMRPMELRRTEADCRRAAAP